MGFLDRAKKLAEQAREMAEDALAEARSRAGSGGEGGASAPPSATDPRMGTPYVPGMFGRPGWRERGLTDPAAILPIRDRDRVGVPHSTKSQIVEEPFGMGRRWTAGARSVSLFYQLYPEHLAWEPPGGRAPLAGMAGAAEAVLPDGRALVFLAHDDRRVVFEAGGLDDSARLALARTVSEQLGSA